MTRNVRMLFSRRKLIVFSVIFNLGMCFYSYVLASTPYSKNSLSYLVPKNYSTDETPPVTKTYPGYFVPKDQPVTKKHPVTKSHTKKHAVTKSDPVAKRYPVAKTYPDAKPHRVTKSHKRESRWVFGNYPVVVGYPPIAVSLLVGGGATNIGTNHKIVFSPGSFRTDSFTTDNEPIEVAAAAGISYDFHIGKEWEKHFLRDITLGLNGYYNQSIVNGAVYEYSLPSMPNSNYDLRLKTGRLMIDTELDFSSPWGTIIPFVELGIGVASHTLYFKNSPVPNIGVSGGGYALQDHTQFNFAYEAGVGLKIPLRNQFMLSARYLYANVGQAKTSTSDPSSGMSLAKPVVFDVSSQSILFGFSYLIG